MAEKLKQLARDFVKEYLRDNLILDEEALVRFAIESTKELQEENKRLKKKLEEFKPNRCKNYFHVSENGQAVICYKYRDCNVCPLFKE